MPRPIWSGSISFGLVQIPVSLYPAEHRDELRFTLLDRRDHAPVGYQFVNKVTGRAVPQTERIKGYEVEQGEYVLLEDEDFHAANVEKTETIDILAFVPEGAIAPAYFERPYYLAAERRGEKAYALLRETLERTRKLAVAQVVLRARQHLCAIFPERDRLGFQLLRYHHELRDPAEVEVPHKTLRQLHVSEAEIEMARRLVEGMSAEWRPELYHDTYRDDLLALIEEKRHHPAAAPQPEPRPQPRSQVADLLDLLRQSVEARAPARRREPQPARRMATARTRRKA